MTKHHEDSLPEALARLQDRLDRRQMLGLLAGAAALPMLASCDERGEDTGTVTDTGEPVECTDGDPIPSETAGPYPGDGSNGVNALLLSGIVRSDITPNLDGNGEAEGVPLTIELQIVDADGCTPLEGVAVYLWHCDRDGEYSLYTAADADYLRGVQVTDADGRVTFTSIFPGCYSGRWPHIHFEVYPDLASTSSANNVLVTSQLALPAEACDVAYEADGYDSSVTNFAQADLSTDNVFSDGVDQQLATTSGSVAAGFTTSLVVPV
ncbi:MAG: intradiol ring-cleavage dioxygenase [Myxococcota bacterium]